MKHLSDDVLVDLAEGGRTGFDHLETCAVCRARVQAMRQTMGLLQADRVPEPSPLFWDHLSERVARAVREEAIPPGSWWTVARWNWSVAAAAAIIVAVVVIIPIQRKRGSVTGSDFSVAISSPRAGHDNAGNADDVSWALADAGESWQIVEGAAADLDLKGTQDAGIFVRAGSIDRELLMLSDQERRDLVRVIQAELDRSRL